MGRNGLYPVGTLVQLRRSSFFGEFVKHCPSAWQGGTAAFIHFGIILEVDAKEATCPYLVSCLLGCYWLRSNQVEAGGPSFALGALV